jgi:hypothetical protein
MQHLARWFKRGTPAAEPTANPVPTPTPNPPAEPAATDVESLASLPEICESVRSALADGAHGLLFDAEEDACHLYRIESEALPHVRSCALSEYEAAIPVLRSYDKTRLSHGALHALASIYGAVTDLGERLIMVWGADEAECAERRKATVRLINRLRPGTALSRRNRESLLRAVRRGGAKDEAAFVERLRAAELLQTSPADDVTLERLVYAEVLPRKATALVLAEYLGLRFVDAEQDLPRSSCARRFDKHEVIEWEALPYNDSGERVLVAMADPTDDDARAKIRARLDADFDVCVAAATDIRVAADKLFRRADRDAAPAASAETRDEEAAPSS